ncbi:MAG TPA: FAD:protein FMN transferase [Candidatus Saccharimonadales bacterium]|nr:FAD:protein FMN transferase [Candidatus Saccharimonadales bacterium]
MQTTSLAFEAIGTHWQIDIPQDTSPMHRDYFLNEIVTVIEDFDKTYSRFRIDSLVTQIFQKKGTYRLPDNAQELFRLYRELYDITNHAVTPLIGQVLVEAGYDATYSLKPKKLHKPPQWDDVIDYNYPNLTVKKPALLDFGAAGKGYLIDLVAEVLKKHNLAYFCVDAGGDMSYYNTGNEKLRVGLEHPDNPKEIIGIVEIHNQSICGSAGNRRKWGEFHHIIDPETLSSVHKVKAVWVVAETGLLADGIATCLFFTPAKKLLKKYNFSYTLIYENNSIEFSKDFPAKIF